MSSEDGRRRFEQLLKQHWLPACGQHLLVTGRGHELDQVGPRDAPAAGCGRELDQVGLSGALAAGRGRELEQMGPSQAPAADRELDQAADSLLTVLDGLTRTEVRSGVYVTLSPLTYGRGRISLGPDMYTVSEFW